MGFRLPRILPSLSLAVCGVALAQTPPDAGSLSRQIEQEQAPRPTQKTAPDLHLEQSAAPVAPIADQTKIMVKNLQITGAQVFSEADLLTITGFKSQSELTLSSLRNMASKIAHYYHQHGYFMAQAYLPAQEINDGTVVIAVIEGRYGKVTLQQPDNLSHALTNSLVNGLNSGDTIAIAPLETRLLLLSDIPGVNVKSTLVPGASVGTSDLIVDVTPGARVTGNINGGNTGNHYTGENRVGATVNLNNPTGHGDVLSVQALTSGSGLITQVSPMPI